jgi:multimeric flavodoxin WrbA
MGKHILVLSCSPRKGGNSDTICDRFIEGARSAGHEVEKIHFKDKRINYCTGCGLCHNRAGHCSQKDDMTEILARMVAADVIVMATPIYFYSVSGQMKTLIDRACARYTEIVGKEFYFIMTAADGRPAAMDRALEAFRGFTDCLTDARECGVIRGTGLWGVKDATRSAVLKEAYEMGAAVK